MMDGGGLLETKVPSAQIRAKHRVVIADFLFRKPDTRRLLLFGGIVGASGPTNESRYACTKNGGSNY